MFLQTTHLPVSKQYGVLKFTIEHSLSLEQPTHLLLEILQIGSSIFLLQSEFLIQSTHEPALVPLVAHTLGYVHDELLLQSCGNLFNGLEIIKRKN